MSSFSIRTNMTAQFAQRQISQSTDQLSEQLKQLSSGLRLNSASDGPAALAISQKLTTQIKGQSQAAQNLQDGLSMLQTASGATRAIESNLQRIRELSVRANNATLTTSDRQKIQEEISQLTEQIDRIAGDTQFNNKNLLNGNLSSSNGGVQLQAGANSDQTVSFSIRDLSSGALGVDSIDVTTSSGAEDAMESVDNALNELSTQQSELGAAANRFKQAIDVDFTARNNMMGSRSKIRDADLAQASVQRTQSSILTQAGTSLLAQANQMQGSNALKLL